MNEAIWKPLNKFKNFPDNIYEVSKFGHVRVIENKKVLHQKIANKRYHPYFAVYLHNKDGKGEWVLVHQLVAWLFCEISESLKSLQLFTQVVPDHLDNDGLNNIYTNIEWRTRGDNVRKAFERGEINRSCDNHQQATITNQQAKMICKFLEQGFDYDKIIEHMGFPNDKSHRQLLVRIKNRIAWKDISKDYSFDKTKIKYSKAQMESIRRIKDIQKLSKEGFKTRQIVLKLWDEKLSEKDIQRKMRIVHAIIKGKIYRELLEGSSTRESK